MMSQDRSIHLFCAASSGGTTLDQGEGGGNPFASALIDLLGRSDLTVKALAEDIVTSTERKSGGHQRPDVPPADSIEALTLKPVPPHESRVALVLVVADYSASGGASSLPGAARDAERVANALAAAQFKTTTVVDPNRRKIRSALQEFRESSSSADIAVLYTTGHGVEIDGMIYLLPGDYPVSQGNAALPERAVPLTEFSQHLWSRQANLLFYAGCRNAPFS